MIARAREEGLPLPVETCPHYLTFAAEEIPDGDPRFKCAPPIRERENRERLWEGLRQGLIDTIGSDHSPAPPELKHLRHGRRFPRLGRHRLAPARPAGRLDRGAPARVHARRPGRLDGPCARPCSWASPVARERSPRAATPTSSSSIPSTTFTVDPDGSSIIVIGQLPTKAGFWTVSRRHLLERPRWSMVPVGFSGLGTGQTLLRSKPAVEGSRLMNLERINAWTEAEASESLLRCCGSRRWSRADGTCPAVRIRGGLVRNRRANLVGARGDRLARSLRRPSPDRRPGRLFAPGLPRPPPGRAANRPGDLDASDDVLADLARATAGMKNVSDYIFIVCATGKTAAEMLALLAQRLPTTPRPRSRSPPASR